MIKAQLIHPQITAALARAGHGSRVLLSDGNYPHSTARGPNTEVVYLNLAPGLVGVCDVLRVLTTAIPVEHAAVMAVNTTGPYAMTTDPDIWAEYRSLLSSTACRGELQAARAVRLLRRRPRPRRVPDGRHRRAEDLRQPAADHRRGTVTAHLSMRSAPMTVRQKSRPALALATAAVLFAAGCKRSDTAAGPARHAAGRHRRAAGRDRQGDHGRLLEGRRGRRRAGRGRGARPDPLDRPRRRDETTPSRRPWSTTWSTAA